MFQNGLRILRPEEGTPAPRDEVRSAGTTNVLLVEDDPGIAAALQEALQDEGLTVAAAANGRDALQILRAGLRPSTIILDLMMPVMDGWTFRQEQVRDPGLKDIPVVVTTAAGFSAETIQAQLGNVHLLPKPVPLSTLLELLDRAREPASSAA